MKRILIVLILVFPIVSLAWFCYWGFNQPRTPLPWQTTTNGVIIETNVDSTTNQPR